MTNSLMRPRCGRATPTTYLLLRVYQTPTFTLTPLPYSYPASPPLPPYQARYPGYGARAVAALLRLDFGSVNYELIAQLVEWLLTSPTKDVPALLANTRIPGHGGALPTAHRPATVANWGCNRTWASLQP